MKAWELIAKYEDDVIGKNIIVYGFSQDINVYEVIGFGGGLRDQTGRYLIVKRDNFRDNIPSYYQVELAEDSVENIFDKVIKETYNLGDDEAKHNYF